MNKLKTIIPIAIIAAIGGIIRKLSFIEFQVPPLVEGPRVVFFIPLPEFLHKIPFAMETANGGYGLPVTITVVTTWFLILFMFILFRVGTSKLEVIPGKLQLILESIYAFLDGVVGQMMGSWKKNIYHTLDHYFYLYLQQIQ